METPLNLDIVILVLKIGVVLAGLVVPLHFLFASQLVAEADRKANRIKIISVAGFEHTGSLVVDNFALYIIHLLFLAALIVSKHKDVNLIPSGFVRCLTYYGYFLIPFVFSFFAIKNKRKYYCDKGIEIRCGKLKFIIICLLLFLLWISWLICIIIYSSCGNQLFVISIIFIAIFLLLWLLSFFLHFPLSQLYSWLKE